MVDTPKEVRAIGFNIVVNLDGSRQITLQDFISSDLTSDEANARLDFAMALADRQKARYELVDLRDELSKHRDTLAQAEEDLARVDAEFEKAQAALDIQILAVAGQRKERHDAGYAEFTGAGRAGAFKPKGALEGQLRNLDTEIENIKLQKQKNEAERDQHRQSVMISIDRFTKAIAEREVKIAEREKLLGT